MASQVGVVPGPRSVDEALTAVGAEREDRSALKVLLEKIGETTPQQSGKWLVYRIYLSRSLFNYLSNRNGMVKKVLAAYFDRPFKLEWERPHWARIVVLGGE